MYVEGEEGKSLMIPSDKELNNNSKKLLLGGVNEFVMDTSLYSPVSQLLKKILKYWR